jgi:hypothetical protein
MRRFALTLAALALTLPALPALAYPSRISGGSSYRPSSSGYSRSYTPSQPRVSYSPPAYHPPAPVRTSIPTTTTRPFVPAGSSSVNGALTGGPPSGRRAWARPFSTPSLPTATVPASHTRSAVSSATRILPKSRLTLPTATKSAPPLLATIPPASRPRPLVVTRTRVVTRPAVVVHHVYHVVGPRGYYQRRLYYPWYSPWHYRTVYVDQGGAVSFVGINWLAVFQTVLIIGLVAAIAWFGWRQMRRPPVSATGYRW